MTGLEDSLPETKASKEAFEDARWATAHLKELREQYKGKWIAVVNKQVIAAEDNAKKVYDVAQKQYPLKVPVLYFVAERDIWGMGHGC